MGKKNSLIRKSRNSAPTVKKGITGNGYQFVSITNALATDSVNVTPPSTLVGGLVCTGVPGAGGHYVRMANVTSGAIDPASATFTIDIWRRD